MPDAHQDSTASTSSAPLIIEAAINGATPKSRNPNSPRTPAEIAEVGLECLEAGAAIVHNHNDEGLITPDGTHSAEPYIEAWKAILAERADALLYPTMGGGGPHTTIEKRYSHIPALFQAGVMRLGLVDPGSVNVGGPTKDGLPAPIDMPYINTLKDAAHMFLTCDELQLGPSISCFEPGFVRVALAYHRAGKVKGAMVKLYFGGPLSYFGLPPTKPSLEAYLAMLEGTGLQWSVAVLGGDVIDCGLAKLAIERGGHVRVGLEDYAGPRQATNVELIRELVSLASDCGRPIATCEQATEILGLPRKSL